MKFPWIASKLKTATTQVNIASATAPTSGQVLTATSWTLATWQTVSWWSTQIIKIFAIAWTIWATWTNVSRSIRMNWTYTLQQVDLYYWYWTPWNWTLTIDVNKNWTTVFSTTKPSITWTNQGTINSWVITTSWCIAWDYYTLDIDAVPWTTFWTDLYVELVFTS